MNNKTLLSLAVFFTLIASSFGAVKLLTGDANNNLHGNEGLLLDISADGNLILFASGPPVTGSTPGITEAGLYLRNISANTLTFLGTTNVSVEGTMSDNGRYVAWRSQYNTIYWRDCQSKITRLITPGANGPSRRPVMSADGRYVAYASVARNIPGTTSLLPAANRAAVFLYDSVAQTTRVISLSSTGAAIAGIAGAGSAAPEFEFDFSADGRYVTFSSDATNVHPSRATASSQAWVWVYRRNIGSGVVDVVCKSAGNSIPSGNFATPRISANGARIVFIGGFSYLGGSLLSSGYNNPFGYDMFLKDMSAGQVWWVTKTTNSTAPDGYALGNPAISGNGNVVAFSSDGTKFVAENTDSHQSGDSIDAFRVDIGAAGTVTTKLITKAVYGTNNVGLFSGPFLPGTGNYVAFVTRYFPELLNKPANFYNHGVGVGTLPAPLPRYYLTKTVTPASSGYMTVSPVSTNGYASNSIVTLTAFPNTGFKFVRWSGASTATTNRITLTMNANKTIQAVFTNLPKYTLTTNVRPSNAGIIALSPTNPTNAYFAGTTVSLTANASDTNIFAVWMGAAAGLSNKTAVTMTANKSVTALFNNPGKFVFQNTNGEVAVWFMQNTQKVATAPLNNGVTAGANWKLSGAADFDQNGFKDLVLRSTVGQVRFWQMSANNLTNIFLVRGGFVMATNWTLVGAADLDGDTNSDLLWQNTNGVLQAWLMNGTAYSTNATLDVTVNAGARVAALADFNGDQSTDYVVQGSDASVSLWLMSGLTRTNTVALSTGAAPPTGWRIRGATDLDENGQTDIVFQKSDGSLMVWFMDGTSYVQSTVLSGTIAPLWSLRAVK